MTPLRVELAGGLKWFSYFGIVFFGFFTIVSWHAGVPVWLALLFLVALFVFLLLLLCPVEMNDQFIPTAPSSNSWDKI